ncbi:YjzD family protein [Cytobacillus sp. Hm23]|uniref:YjzD family protein n=1 Tax=Cytobacillus sp. IB215665 TaxID=3097357 RepID=UPI002A0FD5C6|nr:YjzD family protein [Cytobacillus sp. IB215665]MDX8364459.1 YjzD family protein [Cytobacillus sp. IB215665]
MRYFWTFFWTFLLVHMATYVGSSMLGAVYSFTTGTILAVAFTLFVFIIGEALPIEPTENH